MVMTALARNLRAWWALMRPEVPGLRQAQHREKRRVLRQELKALVNAFVTPRVWCSGRRLVLRVPGWNAGLMTFFRLVSRPRE